MDDKVISELACTKEVADHLRACDDPHMLELMGMLDDHRVDGKTGCEYFLWDGIHGIEVLDDFLAGEDQDRFLQRNEIYDGRWFSGRFVDNPFFSVSLDVNFSSPSGFAMDLARFAGPERAVAFLDKTMAELQALEERPGPSA